jgi:two-component system, NarL family, response regulator NreC
MSAAEPNFRESRATRPALRPSEPALGNTPGISIVLADDHPIVRLGLRTVLEEAGFEVLAEATDVAQTRRQVLAHEPDVLLLDLSMPGGSSLEAIPDLLEISPRTAIVILTMHDEPALAREALRVGARAFVVKEEADSHLVEAILAASGGGEYLTPRLGARMAAQPATRAESPEGLTDREVEVIKRLAAGYTNSEIAQQMFLAKRTIEAHRAQLARKLGHRSRAGLVAYARANGLFP